MNQIWYFIIGAVAGVIGALLVRWKKSKVNDKFEKLKEINVERKEKTEQNKKKILEFMANHEKVKNDDIRAILSVSDATVERYFQELEKEGKIVQEGEWKASCYKIRP